MFEALIAFLIVLVIICVVGGILYAIVTIAPIPAPFSTIATYIIWGIVIIAILLAVLKYLVPALR